MVTDILKSYLPEHADMLSEQQFAQLEKYADLLKDWNKKMNLTAIIDDGEIAAKHFLDCLAFLRRVDIKESARVADVGTGAGFPGIVLKIARPDIELVLIDSLQKRLNFLNMVLKEISVKATLIHARAEDAGHTNGLRESFDFVTARAVANLSVLSEYCLPLVKQGGVFAPMKTGGVEKELCAAQGAVSLLGGKIRDIKLYTVPVAGGRSAIIIDKVMPTPTKYPRQRVKISEKPLKQ